jgi:exosome complex exonuclease DIS3/RRP44
MWRMNWVCHFLFPFFFFLFFRYGIEGPVYLTPRSEKGGGEWFVDEQQQKIKKMDGSLSYSVLQTVRIHMEVVEPQPNRPKLQLTLT